MSESMTSRTTTSGRRSRTRATAPAPVHRGDVDDVRLVIHHEHARLSGLLRHTEILDHDPQKFLRKSTRDADDAAGPTRCAVEPLPPAQPSFLTIAWSAAVSPARRSAGCRSHVRPLLTCSYPGLGRGLDTDPRQSVWVGLDRDAF